MTRQARIESEALEWLIRREELGWESAAQSELDAWLAASMAHKAAFWRAEHGWRETDRIRSLGSPEYSRLLSRRYSRWSLPIAASVALAIVIGAYRMMPNDPSPPVATLHYVTALGDRQAVPLPDGSKVELNTSSTIRASISLASRDVWLDAGEAYFEVAHRDGLPFVVHAGSETITVLGTKFSVRRDQGRVTVSVMEGRVQVANSGDASGRVAIITKGDIAVARGSSTLIAGKSDDRVANALAWRDGMLSFDQELLPEVVAEFNRYNRMQVTVAGNEARDIRIGGTFRATNVEAFLRLLRDAYGLRIATSADGAKILD